MIRCVVIRASNDAAKPKHAAHHALVAWELRPIGSELCIYVRAGPGMFMLVHTLEGGSYAYTSSNSEQLLLVLQECCDARRQELVLQPSE